jgi:hypothetical protein
MATERFAFCWPMMYLSSSLTISTGFRSLMIYSVWVETWFL